MKDLTIHDDFDEILLAVIQKKEVNLSEKELQSHQMLMYAAQMLKDRGYASKCINDFAEKFNVHPNTARNYLRRAPEYYQIVEPFQEANFLRTAIYGKILETREKIEALCLIDAKTGVLALNQNDKNLLAFAEKLLPNVNAINYDDFKPQPTLVQFRPDLVVEPEMSEEDLLREIQKLNVVDTDRKNANIEDIEHEEV
jgi:hypothetical protein